MTSIKGFMNVWKESLKEIFEERNDCCDEVKQLIMRLHKRDVGTVLKAKVFGLNV